MGPRPGSGRRRPRKNRTGPSPRPAGVDPMRLCPCWGKGSGVGLLGKTAPNRNWRGPRPTSPPGTAKQLPQPGPSGENYDSVHKKPLCGNRQEKNNGLKVANTGSRKHNVNSAHPSSTCLLLQRDRLKLLRQFTIRFSNRPTNCQRFESLLNQMSSDNFAFSLGAPRAGYVSL